MNATTRKLIRRTFKEQVKNFALLPNGEEYEAVSRYALMHLINSHLFKPTKFKIFTNDARKVLDMLDGMQLPCSDIVEDGVSICYSEHTEGSDVVYCIVAETTVKGLFYDHYLGCVYDLNRYYPTLENVCEEASKRFRPGFEFIPNYYDTTVCVGENIASLTFHPEDKSYSAVRNAIMSDINKTSIIIGSCESFCSKYYSELIEDLFKLKNYKIKNDSYLEDSTRTNRILVGSPNNIIIKGNEPIEFIV